MLKILLVITGLGMGGAEHVVVSLADGLDKLGHDVKIVYITGSFLVSPISPAVKVIPVGISSYRDFFKAFFKLRKIVKDFKPDVVHSHMYHSNILSRLLRLTIKIPKLICSVHNTIEGGMFRMLAYRITDHLADISTNVSEEAVKSFINKGAVKSGRMVVVPNGVDTDKFYFSQSARFQLRRELAIGEKKLLLSVGRLHVQKDYPNLLNAISLLKECRQDFKLIIVGDGPLRKELHDLVKKLNLESFVDFIGVRYDVSRLMSAADVFVLSSAWEGFGLVVGEAMSCERVVVATDCGGVSEVVDTHGFIVQKQNHISLAKELNKVLDMDSALYSEIGFSARQQIINKYSLYLNINEYNKLYLS